MAHNLGKPTPPPPQPSTADAAQLKAELKLFKFYVKQAEQVVPTASIICAISTKDGLNLYTVQAGERKIFYSIKRTLASMAAMRECGFLRIHLSVMINMAYYRGRDSDRIIMLSHRIDTQLKVSERYMADLNEFLKLHCY